MSGSPAHAGIDPRPRRHRHQRRRLPRPRGDRPEAALHLGETYGAPPPTRGSTRGHDGEPRRHRGSPAHAGIDPGGRAPPMPDPWLPRPRGDRPLAIWQTSRTLPAPPPTRGSTPKRDAEWTRRAGSPAHAGIDPPSRSGFARAAGLPRPRGDRPSPASPPRAWGPAPPPTRGSTLIMSPTVAEVAGSPAHAGIDPSRPRPSCRRRRLPRPRGDRPRWGSSTSRPVAAPPPTRGSTPSSAVPMCPATGSPAHAGIDPR